MLSSLNGLSGIGVGGAIISVGTPVEQPMSPQVLQQDGLRQAKKCARVFVQHEVHDDAVGQLAVQLLHDEPQAALERQPRLHGIKQSSERSPRRSFSSKHGRGQQLPIGGAGIGVLQPGAQVVHDGAGDEHVLQPP
ncbi:hypothetical protein ETAA8_61020 [Anatilimnocola aggregata]|uniref:Uncharacterized protein n=1 Tax=Anatilimnocola aggregata TaxID=2528021 RepID=A0A517YL47_9BACT|nr:hypothetical protein [Anatilimnocola aggregata]QDU30949.1 hypothetical protein ETAA8_61020 [Anatilimnocola aggregata]